MFNNIPVQYNVIVKNKSSWGVRWSSFTLFQHMMPFLKMQPYIWFG